MNLQMGIDPKQKASYDYWKPYLYEKGENLKRFSSLLYSEADSTARVSVEEKSHHEASYKCSLCGKSFSSGKALGGHRRSHVQASKKKFSNNSKEGTSVNNNRSSITDYDDDVRYHAEEKNHICYVCKKNFPTKNALYGHMRSHPDRVFKGVSPPSNLSHENKNCSSNSQSSNSSVDQNKEDQEDGFIEPKGESDFSKSSLPRWKRRGKRGRKCSESYEAAMNLMHLSANNTKHLCSWSVKKFDPSKVFVESSLKKMDIGESSSTGKEPPVKKIKFVFNGILKLGNKSDVYGNSENVFSESSTLNKGNGLLSEFDNNTEPSEFGVPKRLEIDLNLPYVMED